MQIRHPIVWLFAAVTAAALSFAAGAASPGGTTVVPVYANHDCEQHTSGAMATVFSVSHDCQQQCIYQVTRRILFSDVTALHVCNWSPGGLPESYFLKVTVELCPGYAGAGTLTELTNGTSWTLVNVSGNKYVAISDCYGSACWPNFWSVQFPYGVCIKSIKYEVGCCICDSDPCL